MTPRRALAILAVLLTTAAAALVAVSVYSVDRELSVGTVRVSANPGHDGALDLYVPLVDWGVRFRDTVRLPARVSLDLRTVDRAEVARLAGGAKPRVERIRSE